MSDAYFAIGSSLSTMVNIETLISTPPTVLPEFGGAPMALTGGTARRALSGRLRRSGLAFGAWGFPALDDDFDDLNDLLVALVGDYATASRARYISTIDQTGHYSPYLCYVDAPYVGQSLDFALNDHVRNVRVLLAGGVLQTATKTGNYTVTTSDHHLYADTSGGSITFALPALAGVNEGVVYSFIKTSASNNMVLDPNSTEQIDGGSTKTTTALNARVDIVKSGSAWVSI
jgi:hypothetical protein